MSAYFPKIYKKHTQEVKKTMEQLKIPTQPVVRISTCVSSELWQIAKRCGIRWRDALARGIVLLSKGDRFQVELEQQKEKIAKLSDLLFQANNKLTENEEKVEAIKRELKSKDIRLEILEEKQQEKTI